MAALALFLLRYAELGIYDSDKNGEVGAIQCGNLYEVPVYG